MKKIGPQGVEILNPSTRISRATNLSIATSSVEIVTMPIENHDDEDWHSTVTNTERITVRRAGIYAVGGAIEYAANAIGLRFCIVYKNGVAGLAIASSSVPSVGATISTVVQASTSATPMDAGDYFVLVAYQDSGGPLNALSAFLAAFRLSRR